MKKVMTSFLLLSLIFLSGISSCSQKINSNDTHPPLPNGLRLPTCAQSCDLELHIDRIINITPTSQIVNRTNGNLISSHCDSCTAKEISLGESDDCSQCCCLIANLSYSTETINLK